jgi:N-glycosylase/DNA lyase
VKTCTAVRATESVLDSVPFFTVMISSGEIYERAKIALTRREVGYRFPDARSRQIANSWFPFAQIIDQLYDFLDQFSTETAARAAVTRLFPGLGLRQASMFLRDIGYSARRCIIDTHLLWYCSKMGEDVRGALTPKRYLQIESYLLDTADRLQVAPNVFDSAVWVAVTSYKARQCTMQFV